MIIISPSKRQAEPAYKTGLAGPQCLAETQVLLNELRGLSIDALAKILNISPKLANKAYRDYQALDLQCSESMEAIFLYKGDVFKALEVDTLPQRGLNYLEDNLRIISPLYGLIRPLEGIWPYRLEMVSRLPNHPDLKRYWVKMQGIIEQEKPKYIFNLASQEYASCIKAPQGSTWVDIVFEDKDLKGKYRVVAVKAKRMRGALLRYMAEHNIQRPDQLDAFEHQGYTFDEVVSSPTRIVFRSR